jgi:hypothetical protein
MPTRAVWKGGKFLTQSKPDLAVCFRRQALIPSNLWRDMPDATKCLACYENDGQFGSTRVFHFLTIEAKKAMTSTGDIVGLRQSLNNASQALHNMFSFCRDAGAQYEDEFFTQVRFFSVVASTEGLIIRIHRATREPADGSDIGLIIKERPDYPLRFEYEEFFKIQRESFDRKTVFEIFKKILVGYGVNELYSTLKKAAKALMEKLAKDPEGVILRSNSNFYRFGQTTTAPSSRKPTPAASQAPSIMSVDMLRSGTAMPTQSQAQTPMQLSGAKRKRPRGKSKDSEPARSTRQRTDVGTSH